MGGETLEEDRRGIPSGDRGVVGPTPSGTDDRLDSEPRRPRRRPVKRRKPRHALNPFRYIDPQTAWKAGAALAIYLGSLVGVSHKAGVETAQAVDQATASASIAIYAAEVADSLRVDVERLKRRIAVLEQAAGGEKLAEARKSIGRPGERKAAKPWWRFF